MAVATAVYQAESKAAGVAQLLNGWRRYRQNKRLANATELACPASCQRYGIAARCSAFFPVFERCKCQAHVSALSREAVALNGNHALNLWLLEHVRFYLLDNVKRALIGCAWWQLHINYHHALVFLRHEGCGQPAIKQAHACNDDGVHTHHPHAALEYAAYRTFICFGATVEMAVKPIKERAQRTGFLVMRMPFGNGFEHSRTQGWCERERKKARKRNRHGHNDRELAVNIARSARKERQRQKHHHQNHRNAHYCARNLPHRLERGSLGR